MRLKSCSNEKVLPIFDKLFPEKGRENKTI